MNYEFTHRPAYTVGKVHLDAGEEVIVEAGSMISYSGGVEIETVSGSGGVLSSIKDSMLSDEEMFRNRFRATANGQVVRFACSRPGDLEAFELEDQTMYVSSGAYVANEPGIETKATSGGMSSIRGGKGLFFLEASGSGLLFVGGYGGLEIIGLAQGEEVTIDSGHVVAWDKSAEFSAHQLRGLKQKMLGGEGDLVTFTGPGRVVLQTRDSA